MSKRGLGKGLDALLGTSSRPVKQASNTSSESESVLNQDGVLKEIPIEFLQPGQYQPRRVMTEEGLEELADSIRAQGMIQPIVIRPVSKDKYEIIAGERRWRAAQRAELHQVPVLIKEVPDEAAIAMALIENIQREDLNAMEEANALHRLKEEFNLSHQQTADAVGKSRTTVTNLLRLMQLTEACKTLLERGDLEMGHARALLALNGSQQSDTAKTVVQKGLTVRETEKLIRNINEPKQKKKKTEKDHHIVALEQQLADKIGATVNINHGNKGKGNLVINYHSLDELDGILQHLGIEAD
ncbi:ParB/RepB/Spo0J family partition protein [Kangiella sediminilitoris]|uniref:Probable chromosome-partitioning protein ParB n=1 Tax=Kangiella sediminilitoris TaxID=1144748 RepID=A0A1B3BE03_9GAMM|nr:ParB/RepB/Spo0J family partition protein [Kangiella sediminilitoris]AOE51030.1 chromosome partitioning protein ParB [Kangiella sediminilitoris]